AHSAVRSMVRKAVYSAVSKARNRKTVLRCMIAPLRRLATGYHKKGKMKRGGEKEAPPGIARRCGSIGVCVVTLGLGFVHPEFCPSLRSIRTTHDGFEAPFNRPPATAWRRPP